MSATLPTTRRWHAPWVAGWGGAVLATAVIGGLGSAAAPTFYAALDKPAWAPPAAVFGPVWTVLYLAMATAAVWAAHAPPSAAQRRGLALFGLSLLPNALWSWLFFSWHQGAAALACVLLLAGLLVGAIASLWAVRRGAALLLLPLLAWVSFASVLNAALLWRNPSLL